MKILLLVICLFCFLNSKSEGCNRSGVVLGKYYGRAPTNGSIGPLFFPKYSSYTITALGNFPCAFPLLSVKIYLNNVLIVKLDTNNCYKKDFVLGAYPGSYRIAIIIEGTTLPDIWSFEIIDNPVGLNELGEKQFIAVFPNPAQKFITVQSTREISGVILYDITGSLLSARTAESASVEIPLDEYPPGIYFLHVAILGEQTVIKKIVIQ